MASIRRGFSDDFSLDKKSVGAGITSGQEALDVQGSIKGKDLKVTGISSQTGYEGFLRADHQIAEDTSLSFDQGPVSSLSGEIIVETGKTVTVNEVVKETAGVGNGSNNEWYSLSGSYTFKANGDPTWDGSAFVYDGTGDYHQLNSSGSSSTPPDSTFEVGSSNFTLEQWVYITATSSIVSTFFSKGDNNSVGTEFMSLQTTTNGTIPGFFFGSGSALLTGSAVGTGGWHHYVVTRSGNNFTLYVDGTSVDTATSSNSLASGITGGINIGAQSYSVSADGRKLNGKISITRLYSSRVLTAAEVTLNYNAGHTATTSAAVATVDLNANNPSSYPGTLSAADTTDTTISGGSQIGSLKVFNTFTPPSGGINERPSKPKPGQLYYNYDFKTIEFHDGYGWRQVDNTTRSGRAVFMGGESPSPAYALAGTNISYVNINSLGNSNNFGDLSLVGKYGGSAMSNSTRGAIAGGWKTSTGNQFDIEYITIASEGNAIDWGDNNTGGWGSSGTSSSTRGLSAGGGYPTASVTIDSIFFSTTGTKEDWGDISALRGRGTTGCNDTTRSVFFGGYAPIHVSTIEYKTTASDGDTVFFGDLITTTILAPGMSSSTRGVMGTQNYNANDVGMGYITIATTGNAQYFGDLTIARSWGGATSNQVRGLYVGGRQSTHYNTIDYCTISTAGNFVDFGDLTGGNQQQKACVSDSHGGLGGF